MVARHRAKFEAQLMQLDQGLSGPRTAKKLSQVWERIGRFKEGSGGIGQHYDIEVVADEKQQKAVQVKWSARPKANSIWTDPGTYSLRTNVMELSTAQLWQTYIMLTDLEAVFRSLKSELGLRPIFHQTDRRTQGHWFITVLAYQAVQVVRTYLRQQGISWSWTTIRNVLSSQQRATIHQTRENHAAVHTRIPSEPDADQRKIYEALKIDPHPLKPKSRRSELTQSMSIGGALIGLNRVESPRSTLESIFYVKPGIRSSWQMSFERIQMDSCQKRGSSECVRRSPINGR